MRLVANGSCHQLPSPRKNQREPFNPSLLYRWLRANPLPRWTAATALLGLSVGCSPTTQTNPTPFSSLPHSPLQEAIAQQTKQPKTSLSQLPTACTQTDPFSESVSFALRASNLAQTAKTKEDWDEVARQWVQAVAWMQAVPPSSPRRAFAEKKVIEYMRNLTYSQQQATTTRLQNYSASFSSDLLDRQLQLYLSYIAAVGPPDILIVGSSRALQGIDPKQLKQALAAQGYSGLTVFNFAVNGATAQVVDFQLRQLLTPDQLPQLILWGDGVRAFNSGREDRTYNSIVASQGNQLLLAGVRPKLPEDEPQITPPCHQFPQPCSTNTPKALPLPPLESESLAVSVSHAAIEPLNSGFLAQTPTATAMLPLNNLLETIDSNGFLPLSARYDPATYYRERPLVSGRYDRDYEALTLEGKQAVAFNSVITFAKTRKIPLVFVSLPLTNDYLDAVRSRADQQFRQRMQRLSQEKGFIFRDLSRQWPNRHDYFVDPSHLNREGAIAVSQQLAGDNTIPWPRPKRRRIEG
ncbi:MAG: hypothetical protein ACM37W_11065 [Actinomycetota bacterium]